MTYQKIDVTFDRCSILSTEVPKLLEEIKEKQKLQATKTDIMDLRIEIMKILKNHEKRIENLEDQTGFSNPYKN